MDDVHAYERLVGTGLLLLGIEMNQAKLSHIEGKHIASMPIKARKYTHNHWDAEDVVSECWIDLLRHAERLHALPILKTECIYRHKPSSLREANAMIDRYIAFYNNDRIQTKFGVAPLSRRHSK